jgi:peptidoglycan biosynthesis protein MviN/MurJ (putative lipid II flippase)
MPQMNNLAIFGSASMLLMLIAISSYPFPQRDTFIWLSWATLLGAVVLLLVVFVQINRDRIVSLLHGTEPGKLNWDAALVNQVVLFAIVPALSLLGAQFPDTFRQLISWASKIGSSH